MLERWRTSWAKGLCPQGIYILVVGDSWLTNKKAEALKKINRVMRESKGREGLLLVWPSWEGTAWAKTLEQEEPEGTLTWHYCGE